MNQQYRFPESQKKTALVLCFIVSLLVILTSVIPGHAQTTDPGTTSTPTDPGTPLPTSLETPFPTLTGTATETPTPTTAPQIITTDEFTSTVTVTPTATINPTETLTPTATITPTTPLPIYFPLIVVQPQVTPLPFIEPTSVLYCDNFSTPLSIPDNKPAGIANTISIGDSRIIADLNIYIDISHTWVGDLTVYLTHQDTGKSIPLIDRPGFPATAQGCGNDNIVANLDDEFPGAVQDKCASSPAAISGTFSPLEPLAQLDGDSYSGDWTLKVIDTSKDDVGKLNGWCMVASISENPPPPTPTPPPPNLPSQFRISNVHGQDQALPLDCESRVAVDWARFFGYNLDEIKFFNHLPGSKNPDKGFVGDVMGSWGQIPPNPYGVHAEPIADLLRDYGVPAYAHRPLSWDDLRWEIAQGRPVYVWITGAVTRGLPVIYVPPDELFTVVAPFEHTVMVIGYTPTTVTISDGSSIYSRGVEQFLDSWSVLQNMAITTQP